MPRAFGRYELLRPIARGGMADVYLARRRAAAGIEKRLVVKRIRRERAADPRFLELFVKEARLSVDLAHANIVPVFDFGRSGDELFIAMEYVPGRDLAATLKRARERGRQIDPVLCAHIGAEACEGLGYAHRRRDEAGTPLGVVHRDVSPRNVLLSFAGEVKLVDFGVASLHTDDERGRVRGTLAYMSPEQARGEPVDGRADLFALGMTLAEALTGEPPTPGSKNALLAAARAGLTPSLPATVPAPLAAAIRKATRVAPEDRFADARAMHAALDAIVVAARAADPVRPAPSEQLAAWLAELFPEGGDAEPASDGGAGGAGGEDDEGEDGNAPAVSFLVEGTEAVSRGVVTEAMGAASLRSIAETVGDEGDEGDEMSGPVVAAGAAGVPVAASVGAPVRRRWPWVAGVAAVVAVAGAVVVVGAERREPSPSPSTFTSTSTSTIASPPASARPPASAQPPAPAQPPSSAPAPAPAPAPAITPASAQPPASPRPRPTGPKPPPAPAPALVPVEINAKPWAKVFIDGKYVDDTPFRTELAPGSHTLRFENPDLPPRTRIVTIPHDGPVIENLGP